MWSVEPKWKTSKRTANRFISFREYIFLIKWLQTCKDNNIHFIFSYFCTISYTFIYTYINIKQKLYSKHLISIFAVFIILCTNTNHKYVFIKKKISQFKYRLKCNSIWITNSTSPVVRNYIITKCIRTYNIHMLSVTSWKTRVTCVIAVNLLTYYIYNGHVHNCTRLCKYKNLKP